MMMVDQDQHLPNDDELGCDDLSLALRWTMKPSQVEVPKTFLLSARSISTVISTVFFGMMVNLPVPLCTIASVLYMCFF